MNKNMLFVTNRHETFDTEEIGAVTYFYFKDNMIRNIAEHNSNVTEEINKNKSPNI
jgi:hypothetical protein